MYVIPPVPIYGTSILTSSTVAEPDATTTPAEVVWSSGTTYALGDQSVELTNHRKYQSLQAANLNHALPNYALGETSNAWWVDVGPTNKWAMFDTLRNTQTIGASPLTLVLTPNQRVTALALLGLEGQTVTVSATSGGVSVYGPNVKTIRSRNVSSWFDYFFNSFTATSSLLLVDLPAISNIIITITITNPLGNAKCGACVIGTATDIGTIEPNPISDAINFSTVVRDNFGNVTLTPKRSIPKTTQKVFADASLANTIRTLRTLLNATPAVWSGLNDPTSSLGDTLLIYGFYRTWTIDCSSMDVIEQTIEIEET